MLALGPHTLTVTFTPTDSADYVTTTATTYITVANGFSHVDAGTITLTVGGVVSATTNYGSGSTPATIAAGLAAGVTAGSYVNVTAVNGALYLEAKQGGTGTNYSYSLATTSYDSQDFSQPSFVYPTVSGNLEGGANQNAVGSIVYKYTVPSGGYDGVGNLKNSYDSVMGTWSFGYDNLNRLASSTSGSDAPAQYSGNYGCWSYDAFGNRLSESISTTPCANGPAPTSWAHYNTHNQFLDTSQAPGGIRYDGAGNINYDGVNQYLYDGDGRICAVMSQPLPSMTTMTGYIYDAEGARVSKGTITSWSCDPVINGFQPSSDYVLGLSGEQVTEMGVGANGAMTWQHTNVYAAGSLLATYDQGGLHFYLNDPLGTRRAQTDYAGVPEQTCSSLPFGNGLACTGSNQYPTEHHFTGKERDTESGLDYFGARYYGSTMGRFMSPDTLISDIGDPQTLNLYSYVGNNPMTRVDADGHDWNYVMGSYMQGSSHGGPGSLLDAMRADMAGINGSTGQETSSIYDDFDERLGLSNNLMAQGQTPKTGRQPDGSYIAPTGPGTEIGNITDPTKPLPPMIGNGQCVTACKHLSGITAPTRSWQEGPGAANNPNLPIGTAIATFGSNGKYPTNGDQNSGIYMGQGKNGSILILDQWPAHPVSGTPAHPPQIREMRFNDGSTLSNSAQAYHVIIVP